MPIYEGPILASANKVRRIVLAAAMRKVKDETGKSSYRQAWELWRLSRGPGEMIHDEYYLFGLYDDRYSWKEKTEFGTSAAFKALDRRLFGSTEKLHLRLLNNKLLTGAVLERAGCPTPPIIGLAGRTQHPSKFEAIGSVDNLVKFLATVELPVFGKPMHGSLGLGVMSLFDRSEDGKIGTMGDGREVSLEQLATEILRLYPDGYIFQPFVENHPDIAEFNPRAAQAVRFITIKGAGPPELLYTIWRIPGRKALSDNNSTAGRQVVAAIDHKTGVAIRVRGPHPFEDMDGRDDQPESGLRITGRKLPFYEESSDLVCDMHLLFPDHPILGWDVVQSPNGPVILECNGTPLHFSYQLAFGRGFMNPDIMAKLRPIIEKNSPRFIEKLRRMGAEYQNKGRPR